MKKCNNCLILKPLTDFKSYTRNQCTKCFSFKKNQYRKKESVQARYYFLEYTRNAKKRKINFDLLEQDFSNFINKNCYYCNVKLEQIRLDRLDNNLGYTKDNVVPCCKSCNFLKGSLSYNEFMDKIYNIYKNHGK